MTKRRGRSAAVTIAATPATGAPEQFTRIALGILVLLTFALVLFVRLRFADVPLERDEGEYGYAGRLILAGVPPYALAYNMKFPGTYYAYAALMAVFGQTAWGIRAGLLCVHLATSGLLFLFARRIAGTIAATIAVCAFAVLALDRWTMGVFGHATHFVLLPLIGSLLVLDTATKTGRAWQLLAAGFLAGLAVSMKQHAVFLALLPVAFAVWPIAAAPAPGSRWRRGSLVIAGLAIFIGLMVGTLAASGVLSRFWFWTFQYAAAYVSETPLSQAPSELAFAIRYITQGTWAFWYAAGAGLVLLFLTHWPAKLRVFLLAWLGAAALAIAPGFYFREHYFILMLPVIAVFIGIAVASLDRQLGHVMRTTAARAAALAAFAAIAATYVVTERQFLFTMTGPELMRAMYSTNPFLESPEIGAYLSAHTAPDDRILVLGSEPQILFYASRRSATGYIYMYGLMEAQPYASRMQDEMIREAEAAKPAYLVFTAVSTSWMARPNSDHRILTWANEFTARCYERVGVADVRQDPITRMRWDADSLGFQAQSTSQVLVFRRTARAGCG